jgi:HEAT repeat protein
MSADFQKYLQSVCNAYQHWWRLYTITDVEGSKPAHPKSVPSLFDFGLMVQTVQPQQQDKGETTEKTEKTERLPVQEGLRKYSENHVLLVGRPGSGKSTALARLLLEEAQKTRSPLNPPDFRGEEELQSKPPFSRGVPQAGGSHVGRLSKIPVLVELRQYKTSVLDLIEDFLQRHQLRLEVTKIKDLLFDGQFLLLVDGVNELPNEEARRDLKTFRQNYPNTPMIFTTRDLGVGGDLGIEKKLEMQPLTEEQMQQFVRAYLPEQGEEMLQRLGGRLLEFGQTPLLLFMLCELFEQTGNVPPNLGLVFRDFAQSYERNIKDDIPVSGESRRWWQELLQHLAFEMMQGETRTELRVTIERREAEEIFTKFLKDKVDYSPTRAKEWLEDLLKHHLIQVASNKQIEFRHQLLQEYYAAECLLQRFINISDDKLKRDYLNYLKWTEPLTLMLELVEKEAQAVRVVRLALDVDLQLGARLAGEVKPEFQEKTVGLVLGLEIPQRLKIELLGITGSEQARSPLLQAWNNGDYEDIHSVAEALYLVGYDAAMSQLEEWEDKASLAWQEEEAYEDYYEDYLCEKVLSELQNIGSSDAAVDNLVKMLNDKTFYSRYKAVNVLGTKILNWAVSALLQALDHQDFRVRYHAALALGNIGSNAEVAALVKVVKDENCFVRSSAVEALGKIGDYTVVSTLTQALSDEKAFVRSRAAESLGKIGNEKAISALIQALNNEGKFFVRSKIVEALGENCNKKTLEYLIQVILHLLKDEELDVRRSAAIALGNLALKNIDNELAIDALISTLRDEESSVRSIAAYILGQIGDFWVIDVFHFPTLKDKESSVDSNYSVILENVMKHKYSPHLQEFLLTATYETKDIIFKIQERYQFYNYKIFHSPPVEEETKTKSSTYKSSTYIFHQPVSNLNTGDVNIHGNQIGTQHNQLNNKD